MAKAIQGLPAECLLNHRLEDNDVMAAYARLCFMAQLNESFPIVTAGASALATITGLGRPDRALALVHRVAELGLIKIDNTETNGVWIITLSEDE